MKESTAEHQRAGLTKHLIVLNKQDFGADHPMSFGDSRTNVKTNSVNQT